MTKEFNLSKKETFMTNDEILWKKEKDVKEFIKRLKEECFSIKGGRQRVLLENDIDKLAGDKLI